MKTTVRDDCCPAAPDLLKRDFTATAPNQKWVTDLTSAWTDMGWLYLAVITDRFSNRVVGYAMADNMRVQLPLEALSCALQRRRLQAPLIHHSDRGSQYTSGLYQEALRAAGLLCSMSRKGQCWDNAPAESFFGRLKEELVYGRRWRTQAELRASIEDYIDTFYNVQRTQKRLDYLSPVEYELKHAAEILAA
jgi:putative transposase